MVSRSKTSIRKRARKIPREPLSDNARTSPDSRRAMTVVSPDSTITADPAADKSKQDKY